VIFPVNWNGLETELLALNFDTGYRFHSRLSRLKLCPVSSEGQTIRAPRQNVKDTGTDG